jgi:c(7)-type cytochrome triheme protein
MKRIGMLGAFALALTLVCNVGLVLAGDDYPDDIYFTEPVKGVSFSHETHVGEMGMDCESCHEDIFPMEALASQQEPDFTMKAMAEGRYCGACHDGEMAFDANSRCATCHIGVIGYNRAIGVEEATHGH